MSEAPTLYEWAGAREAIERMVDCFYDRVEHDDLLSPLFPGGVSAAHREHGSAATRPCSLTTATWA
jgi:hemoglobin